MLSIDLSADSKFDTEISDLFSKICYDNRENFNELIMKCSDENKNEINWWVSSPASRNTLNSNLYIDFCKVQLVNHLLSVGDPINEINVDSKAMHNVLTQISGLDKTKITFKRKKIKSTLKEILVILILPLKESLIRSFHFPNSLFDYRDTLLLWTKQLVLYSISQSSILSSYPLCIKYYKKFLY